MPILHHRSASYYTTFNLLLPVYFSSVHVSFLCCLPCQLITRPSSHGMSYFDIALILLREGDRHPIFNKELRGVKIRQQPVRGFGISILHPHNVL